MLVGIGGESSWRSAWDLVGNAEPAMRDERALSVCAHGHSAEWAGESVWTECRASRVMAAMYALSLVQAPPRHACVWHCKAAARKGKTYPIFANKPCNRFLPFSFHIPNLPATYPECSIASYNVQCLNSMNLSSSVRVILRSSGLGVFPLPNSMSPRSHSRSCLLTVLATRST